MSSARPRPRWFFLVSPRWLAWHAFVVVAFWGMLWLGDWQFHRAENGNPLSWAYTFEWPVFALFGVVFWVKTMMDEWRHPGGEAKFTEALRAAGLAANDDLALPGAAHVPATTDDEAADDPELAAYNSYLARLNRQTAQNRQTAPNRQTTREEAGSAP